MRAIGRARAVRRLTLSLLIALWGSQVGAQAWPEVGRYTSPATTFATASYWLKTQPNASNTTGASDAKTASGRVLIDTQFLPKEDLLAAQQAERATGRRVTHALVLHPNPDKFNGTAALQAQGVQVWTSAQVASHIAAVHAIRLGWFADEYKPDYPSDAARPGVFGDSTVDVNWSGQTLKLHVLGPGCSAAHVVAQVLTEEGSAVFVGDLVNTDNHAWLELGRIDDWLKRLDEIQAMGPTRVYPGRGASGGPELLARQANYLRVVQKLVQAEGPRGELGWFTKLKLQHKIESLFPTLGYPNFMRDGLAAVWREEGSKRATGPQNEPNAAR
jgi:glyoxylase-like metal-dependent hydrolase (beta-lactamase superfamily II)